MGSVPFRYNWASIDVCMSVGEVDPLGGCCEGWPIQWMNCFMGSNLTKKESLSGALVTAKSTFGCVTCGAGRVVLWCSLKQALCVLGL